ncbi:MAG: sensor histidine kinase [Candidatus Dormibacteria bacterium]
MSAQEVVGRSLSGDPAVRLGRVLYDLAQQLRSEAALPARLESIGQALAEATCDLVDADDVVIAMVPRGGVDQLRVVGSATGLVPLRPDGVAIFPGTLGPRNMAGSTPTETTDLANESSPFGELCRAAGVNTARIVPLLLAEPMPDGRVSPGGITVFRREARAFSASERELIDGFAALAAAELCRASSQDGAVEAVSAETRLRAMADRARQLENVKAEFLRLASHELRSPLAVARGYVAMIENGDFGEPPQAIAQILPIVSRKLGEMNLLVDQMLETARLEDDRLSLHLETLDLRDAAVEAAATMRSLAVGGNRIAIDLGDEPVTVEADPARLITILTNLIENAVKYSPNGGEVRCTVRRSGGVAAASVSDQGLGIAADQLALLFKRFGRLVTPENSHIYGSGLGLYLAQRLAAMHGGTISAVSTLGTGSTFTLHLPAR